MNVLSRTLVATAAGLVLALRPALAVEPAAPRQPAGAVEAKSARIAAADAALAPQRAASAPIEGAGERAMPAPSVDWSHTPRRGLHARRR
jgi:hypothetical protein